MSKRGRDEDNKTKDGGKKMKLNDKDTSKNKTSKRRIIKITDLKINTIW